ncbi:MAG: ferredoxin [Nanoarchaeota archaeon]
MGKYIILHYKKDCISCGACAVICPEFWEIDQEGVAQLRKSKEVEDHWELEINSEEDRAKNQEAADACPVQIIKVKANGKK